MMKRMTPAMRKGIIWGAGILANLSILLPYVDLEGSTKMQENDGVILAVFVILCILLNALNRRVAGIVFSGLAAVWNILTGAVYKLQLDVHFGGGNLQIAFYMILFFTIVLFGMSILNYILAKKESRINKNI